MSAVAPGGLEEGVDLSTQPKRPDRSLGELFSEMTGEMSTLFRQEVELAKTEAREEAGKLGKASAMFVVAGVSALLALTFLSAGLAWLLDHVMDTALAFALVGVLWAAAAAVLLSLGRKRVKEVRTLPETTRSIKEDAQWVKAQKS
ncbi:MAG: phage holin family protein [Ilumatobacteraceae bacterium]